MVAGHLQLKNGYYYAVLSYYDGNGKRHVKYIATGLTEKGNKRKAEELLTQIRTSFVIPKDFGDMRSDMLFSDFMISWLDVAKMRVKPTTYERYENIVKNRIVPYFAEKKIELMNLQARHIQVFYSYLLETLKPSSVISIHAVIHLALKYAFKNDLVTQNVSEKVDRPRKNEFHPEFLDANEMNHLFEIVKGTRLELPVLVAAFYGLRRGEVLGLKWDAIDFERGTITIKRTVVVTSVDGKRKVVAQDSAKTKSSLRTLPLVANFKEYFEEAKRAQEYNKKVCKKSYNYDYDGFVFVNEMGDIMKPEYLTCYFQKYITDHGMKKIRFHDLRHSCASLLLANGVSLKHIQEWLGHSDFSTTANIYAHLDYSSKLVSAEAMEKGIQLPESVDSMCQWTR